MLIEKSRDGEKPISSVLVVPGWLSSRSEKKNSAEISIATGSTTQDCGDMTRYLLWMMGFHRIGSTPCLALRINSKSYQFSIDTDEVICPPNAVAKKWIHGEANKIGDPFGEWDDQLAWFEREKNTSQSSMPRQIWRIVTSETGTLSTQRSANLMNG